MKLSALIVDDEPLALDLLERYVVRTPFLELKGKCASAGEALQVLSAGGIDVAFLDIQMPGMNGLELSRLTGDGTKVIFTTAFPQYALEGFRADAVDYLLKPFDYAEFLRGANKALKWFSMSRSDGDQATRDTSPGHIFVKTDYRQVRVTLSEVLYIEGLKDYVKIYVSGAAKPVVTLSRLKAMEDILPATDFVRVHRSFIVNVNAVEVIERQRIVFGKTYVPVSDSYREAFLAAMSRKSVL